MRFLKILLYLLAIIVLQSVIFSRLNIFGVGPDLILVTVIIFAVLDKRESEVLFAAAGGFIQDILSFGIYINTIFKVLVSALVGTIKQNFMGNEYSLIVGLVAISTPIVLIAEGGMFFFLLGRRFDIQSMLIKVFLGTIYNLILVPVFLPLTRKMIHD